MYIVANSHPRRRTERGQGAMLHTQTEPVVLTHFFPDGETISTYMWVLPLSEWEERPESSSPIWSWKIIGVDLVFASAVRRSRLSGPIEAKTEFGSSRN